MRSASQKPYSPSPVQDHKGEWFRRPAVPFAGARRRTGWSRLRWRRKARVLAKPRLVRCILGSARFPQPATRAAARRAAEEEEERVREPIVLIHLPTSRTLHLIRWSNSSQTSNVGLNFSSHSTCHSTCELPPLWAASHMGFTKHMGFEI